MKNQSAKIMTNLGPIRSAFKLFWVGGLLGLMLAHPLALFGESSSVVVTLLTGDPIQGELETLSDESVVIKAGGEIKTFARANVLTVKLAGQEETIDANAPKTIVALSDGMHVKADNVSYDGTTLTVQSAILGELTGKGNLLHHVRYAEGNSATLEKWSNILQRESKQDLLVINKEDSIDFVEGVISKLDEKAVYFLLDGEEIPVGISKVFGIILNRKTTPGNPIGAIQMTNKDRLPLASIQYAEGKLSAVTDSGLQITTTLDAVDLIDFRQGRLVYLSELEPRTYEYTPFFDEEWKMRLDKNFDGSLIRIGNQTFTRGLCIHSKTLVRYRLAGEYRRFQAVMGIDELVGNKGHTRVVIKADDQILFEGDVRGSDEPVELDFEVSDKRDLEILVDFGADLSVADHLALGNARLVK
jgi:hypothetical protein